MPVDFAVSFVVSLLLSWIASEMVVWGFAFFSHQQKLRKRWCVLPSLSVFVASSWSSRGRDYVELSTKLSSTTPVPCQHEPRIASETVEGWIKSQIHPFRCYSTSDNRLIYPILPRIAPEISEGIFSSSRPLGELLAQRERGAGYAWISREWSTSAEAMSTRLREPSTPEMTIWMKIVRRYDSKGWKTGWC